MSNRWPISSTAKSNRSGPIQDIAARPIDMARLAEGRKKTAARKAEYHKASVRAKVEHPFRVIKRQFGLAKVRFRGLSKNTAHVITLFALSNLWMARKQLIALMGAVRPKAAQGPEKSRAKRRDVLNRVNSKSFLQIDAPRAEIFDLFRPSLGDRLRKRGETTAIPTPIESIPASASARAVAHTGSMRRVRMETAGKIRSPKERRLPGPPKQPRQR
jgi:hypothetical protein